MEKQYQILFYLFAILLTWILLATQYLVLISKLFGKKPSIFSKKQLLYYLIPFVPYYKYVMGLYDFFYEIFSKRLSNFKFNIKQIK